MAHWTLDDIPWDRFDRSKLDPALVRLAKAASLVESDGAEYTRYLCNVFADDPGFQETARRWGEEEVQHGEALGRWARLADPSFDPAAAFARFKAGFRHDFGATSSIRGSRAGEMVARCMVETGTSSYYSALGESCEEPVLKAIAKRIAADELRHYKLFYDALKACLEREKLGRWGRLRVALQRIVEAGDDELAYAYHAANDAADIAYDRRRCRREYARHAYAMYRPHHVERGMAMVFKAAGLTPNGRLNLLANRVAWWLMRQRAARLGKAA
jgi:hypothetical protein